MNLPVTLKEIDIEEIFSSKNIMRIGKVAVSDLVDSIKQYGLLHPIVVRPVDGRFEIVTGYRRYLSCTKLGWKKILCRMVEIDEKSAFELSLIENLQRNTLTILEEAQAFRKYIDEYGWGGTTELARSISRSPSYVSKRMRLLDLPPDIQELISYSDIRPFNRRRNITSR